MVYTSKIFNITDDISNFTRFVELHLELVPGTLALESKAQSVIAANFEQHLLLEFIEDMHRWGGEFEELLQSD